MKVDRVAPWRSVPIASLAAVAALLIGAHWGVAADADRDAPASRLVEAFVAGDFNALPTRDSLVAFSPGVASARAQDIGEGWPLVDWTWDPLAVIDSYKILSLATHGSSGYALVQYVELARSPGICREFQTSAFNQAPPHTWAKGLENPRSTGRIGVQDCPHGTACLRAREV